MKRALRRFVSKLNGRNKYIFMVSVVLICIVALSLGIYVQFFYKYSDTDPFMIGINIGAKKTEEEFALLESKFNELFINDVKTTSDVINVDKLELEKNVVYTAYNLVNDDETFYSVDAQIPVINIDSEIAKKINTEIKNEYYNKANSIMRQTEGNTVYKVSYAGFVNNDIISIVIKDSTKEQGKAEQVKIKTYTYSMSRKAEVSLDDLISLKETSADVVQSTIKKEIKTAYDNAKVIASEYGTIYERNLESDMYEIKNSNTYFLTNDGYVYIIYPYGNIDYTNEMDIVIF